MLMGAEKLAATENGAKRRDNLFPFLPASDFDRFYGFFDPEELELARDQVKEMFFFGYALFSGGLI